MHPQFKQLTAEPVQTINRWVSAGVSDGVFTSSNTPHVRCSMMCFFLVDTRYGKNNSATTRTRLTNNQPVCLVDSWRNDSSNWGGKRNKNSVLRGRRKQKKRGEKQRKLGGNVLRDRTNNTNNNGYILLFL